MNPELIAQPPLEEAQEVNAVATAMAITRKIIVFLICGNFNLMWYLGLKR
jgi:hypothetical protein